jgi:hypothetical protein
VAPASCRRPARPRCPVPPVDRAAWLRAARQILAEDYPSARGRLVVTVRAENGYRARFEEPADEAPPAAALSPWERDVLQALGDDALEPKAIAARMGKKCNSQFRLLLYNLRDREPPVIVKTEEGYRRVPG